MDTEVERAFTPPYNIPFRTFLNLLQKMEEEGGTPPRIDRSYLRTFSGQAQTYLMGALRSFALIEENGDVTPELDALVLNSQDRPNLLGDILRKYYPAAIAHGEMHGTPKQLEEIFAEYNLSGDTLRKAITFYLHAAEHANLPISRYMKLRKAQPRRTTLGPRKSTPRTKPEVQDVGGTGPALELSSDLRKEYIKKLMERALATEGEPDAQLLDRIERLLGYSQANEVDGTETNGQER